MTTQQVTRRDVKVVLYQKGPMTEDKQKNIEFLLQKFDELAAQEKPDFMMPDELCTSQYFCVVQDNRYFDYAEPVPGPTTNAFAELAKKHGTCIILPLYVRARPQGLLFNAAVVLGPDGKIIEGTLPDGTRVPYYAKCHIPSAIVKGRYVDEAFYFAPGPGFAVFDTPKAKIGIIICYDRHHPEGWRVLALNGAEIVFVPIDSPEISPEKGTGLREIFTATLRTRAWENSIWVCAVNQAGVESVQGFENKFYGQSCIVNPTGEVVAQASDKPGEVVTATINVEDTNTTRKFLRFFSKRRPELYGTICKNTSIM